MSGAGFFPRPGVRPRAGWSCHGGTDSVANSSRHLEDVETYGADGEAKRAELKKELEHDSYQKGATAKWD